jgi:hypothetical protein
MSLNFNKKKKRNDYKYDTPLEIVYIKVLNTCVMIIICVPRSCISSELNVSYSSIKITSHKEYSRAIIHAPAGKRGKFYDRSKVIKCDPLKKKFSRE